MIKKICKYVRDSVKTVKFLLCGKNINENNVLIVTNGMSMSGAPVVLLNIIDYYKALGYEPIVIYQHTGLMCGKTGCKEYCSLFFEKTIQKLCVKYKFKSIFINTIACYSWINFFEKRNLAYNLWIHEGKEYFFKYYKFLPKKLDKGKVFFVSEISKRCLEKYSIKCNSKHLCYPFEKERGCADVPEKKNVLLVGSICRRKNQLELVKAIELVNKQYKKKNLEFIFIGSGIEKKYEKDFTNAIKNIPNIRWYKYVEHKEIMKLYDEIYLNICTSIDDPMPVTITEAIFSNRLVLVSNGTGHFDLLKREDTSYIYELHNINELAQKIIDAFNFSDEEYKNRTKQIYKCFEEYFSKNEFKKCLDEELLLDGKN